MDVGRSRTLTGGRRHMAADWRAWTVSAPIKAQRRDNEQKNPAIAVSVSDSCFVAAPEPRLDATATMRMLTSIRHDLNSDSLVT